jgi:hypothetical protein
MKLLLLRCPNCTNPLTPGNNDVVIGCSRCQEAVEIDDSGPHIVEVHYAIKGGTKPDAQSWLPFWVYEGRVNMLRRETQGRRRSAEKEVAELWGIPRKLFVPAWDLSLSTAQEVGQRMVLEQPVFHFIDRPPDAQLAPATVTPEDAMRLLEFVVLAIEARRKDWLKDIQFELEIGRPDLWAIQQASI